MTLGDFALNHHSTIAPENQGTNVTFEAAKP